MMAQRVNITDRRLATIIAERTKQLEEFVSNPARFGLMRCLLCPQPLFGVGAVEEGEAFIPYGLCATHWGRFENNDDAEIIGEIEAAMRRLVA